MGRVNSLAIALSDRSAAVELNPLRMRMRTALGPDGETLFEFDADNGISDAERSAPVPIVGCWPPICIPIVGMVAVPTIFNGVGVEPPTLALTVSPRRRCSADNVAPPST